MVDGIDFLTEVAARPPLVLGVDPRPELHSGTNALEAILGYSQELFEALAPMLAAVKLQAAFFEALGVEGYALMHTLAHSARVFGIPVIWDVKRGDVGSSATAYARAYLERYPGSAMTANPYLGEDAMQPLFEVAEKSGGAVFVLVKTSNPGSGLFQDLEVAGQPLYMAVAEWLERMAGRYTSGNWSRVGAVVGATYPGQVAELRKRLPQSLMLLPGLGAQGGTPIRGRGLLNAASRTLFYPSGRPDLEASLKQARDYLKILVAVD